MTSNESLFEALRLVMSGGLYVPPSMLGLDVFAQPPGAKGIWASGAAKRSRMSVSNIRS